MALFDAMFEFVDNQAGYAASTTAFFTAAKTIDWQSTGLEMGSGTPLWINARVGTAAFKGGTSIQLVVLGDTAAGGHDASSTEICRGPVVAIGSTTTTAPGAWICRMPLPSNCDSYRYMGVAIVNDGANTAGTVDCWLDHGPQSSFDTQVTTSNI